MVIFGVVVSIGSALAAGCNRQSSAMNQGQAAAILNELQEIRKLLEGQGGAPQAPQAQAPRPRSAEVSIADAHSFGSLDAPVTMVEFTDYQCPFCSRFATTTFGELKAKYIDTGQVRLVSRDLPLPMHANAEQAAYAARCADEQGKYWEMREVMFQNINALDDAALVDYAADLGLDGAGFEACLGSGKYTTEVQADMAAASAIGLTGTPSFVVGRASGDTVEGTIIVGAQPFATFEAQIQALLNGT
jgi:protein-disulfide isomerase|tara:strand:- start:5675 stop:6412 length:738 start_codon:yes stop_codon:yes gene_type:complete